MHPAVLFDRRFKAAKEQARELREAYLAIEAVSVAKRLAGELESECGFPKSVGVNEEGVTVTFERDGMTVQVIVSWE